MSDQQVISSIPAQISDVDVLKRIHNDRMQAMFVQSLKSFLQLRDEVLSEWLNISLKTFRNYKKSDAVLSPQTQEQIILLIALFKQGRALFGDSESFLQWLEADNFFLEGKPPLQYLDSTTGIRFISDRLTAMEYGDNI